MSGIRRVIGRDLQSLAFYGDPEDLDDNVYTDDNSMVDAVFNSFVNGFNPAYGEEGWGAYEQMGALFGNSSNMSAFNLLKAEQTDPSRPHAFMNYMVFDDNMELVTDQSGAVQVGPSSESWHKLELSVGDIEINQNGYLAVYLTNEQYRRIWFDNLYMVHYRGRLIEEHHYYPHGLTLSDAVAANHEPSPYLHQTKKLQKEAGLMLYDFHARQYDPQIGRFWSIDPADQFPSGYTGMGNDPANLVDPTGMKAGNPGGVSGVGLRHPSSSGSGGSLVDYMRELGDMNEDSPRPSGWDEVIRSYHAQCTIYGDCEIKRAQMRRFARQVLVCETR